MTILINIKNGRIGIILLDSKKELDHVEILEEHSLSQKLLPEIDALLEKNKLVSKNIEKIEVKSNQEDSFTTTRIAKAVANAWNFASS